MNKNLEIEKLIEAQHLAQFLLEKLNELSKTARDQHDNSNLIWAHNAAQNTHKTLEGIELKLFLAMEKADPKLK